MDDISDHIIKILTILPAIFVVLSVHEFGHYITAQLFGVHADEYSLGYGKKLYSKKLNVNKGKNQTNFMVRLLPIGAHVQLNHKEYDALSFTKKLLVILAGPFFNFALILPLFFMFFLIAGQPSTPPVFAGIEIGGVADKAGLKTNDRILSANGKEITRYEQIIALNKTPPIDPIDFKIQRKNELENITVKPEILSYVDINGLRQKHGRLGVLARHAPYDLRSITAINKVSIPNDDRGAARTLIIKNLDRNVIISFKSTDGSIRDFSTFLDKDLNTDLFDKSAKDYDKFYVGMIGSNFYRQLSFLNALQEASEQTKDIVIAITKIPFQLFPIDKEEFKPDETAKNNPIKNWIYKFIFFTAVISVLVGFINLIPLPHFDGGQLILLIASKINPKTQTPKNKALIIVASLSLLYAAIAFFNYSNFHTFTQQKFCNSPEWEDQKNC